MGKHLYDYSFGVRTGSGSDRVLGVRCLAALSKAATSRRTPKQKRHLRKGIQRRRKRRPSKLFLAGPAMAPANILTTEPSQAIIRRGR